MTPQNEPHRPGSDAPPPRWAPWRRRTALDILWLACIANFFAVLILWGFVFPGDAWNGKVEDGRYFLGLKGRHTEVSEAVFRVSWWHTTSLLVSWPFVMIYGGMHAVRDWAARRDAAGSDR